MGKGSMPTKELVRTAQERRVKKWRNAPKRGIAQACLLELERKITKDCGVMGNCEVVGGRTNFWAYVALKGLNVNYLLTS